MHMIFLIVYLLVLQSSRFMVENVTVNSDAAVENLNCTGIESRLQHCQLNVTNDTSCTSPLNTVTVECTFEGKSPI